VAAPEKGKDPLFIVKPPPVIEKPPALQRDLLPAAQLQEKLFPELLEWLKLIVIPRGCFTVIDS
jgi:hypothetical protein